METGLFSNPWFTPDSLDLRPPDKIWMEVSVRPELLSEFCDETDKNSDELCQGILVGVEALQASPDPPEQPVDSLAWFSGLTQRPPGQEQYFGPTDEDDSNHYHNFRNSFAPHLDLAGCLVATINQNRLENLARECKSEAERQKLIFQMQVARSVSPIPHAYDDGMGHFAWSPYESEEEESSEWSEMSVISSSIESDFESSEQDPDFLSCSAEQYYGTDESFESHSSDQRSKSI